MVRRRPAEPSYDSVLDTMTNVVGILVIVVALTRLGVADAVERARTAEAVDGIPLGPELVEKTALELAELRNRVVSLRGEEKEASKRLPGERSVLATIQRAVERIQAEAGEQAAATAREKELEGELTKLREGVAELEPGLEQIRSELAVANLALENTPVVAAVNLALTLPDPSEDRAVGKYTRYFVCKEGKVYPFRWRHLLEQVKAAIDTAGRSILARRNEGSRLAAVERHFRNHDVGDSTFRVHCKIVNQRKDRDGKLLKGDLYMRFDLRKVAYGDTVRGLGAQTSLLRTELGKLRSARHWIVFYVYSDSFGAYPHSRALAESLGFAVGWLPFSEDEEIGYTVGVRGGSLRVLPD